MTTDEYECLGPVSPKADSPDAKPIAWRRGHVVGVLTAALVVAELSKDVPLASGRGDWFPACGFFFCGVIAGLPFLLARLAPQAAGFDRQWLPSSRRHWAWFLGMVFVLAGWKILVALAHPVAGRTQPGSFIAPATPLGVVCLGIVIVFIGPVSEEIFFRGYVLEQLRKLARPGLALLIQSLLFGLWHLYPSRSFSAINWFSMANAFVFGMIAGAWRIKFRSLLPVVLAHVFFNALAIIPLKDRYDEAIDRSRARAPTISKETTYITEPLREDGYPDYVAALDRRLREGVTPENNAAVLLWKAVGPGEIWKEHRERYFEMLGIPPLPEKGDYFVDLDKYLAQQKDIARSAGAKSEPGATTDAYDLLAPALKRPWSKEEFPLLAAWLATNEKPLALVVEASNRSRRYDPLVGGKRTPVIAVHLPAHSLYRSVCSALRARAMLRLKVGMVNEAWADLLTSHRLARLVGQSPMAIDAVIAGSLDEAACAGDQALLQNERLAAAQTSKMRQDLDRLPAMPPLADRYEIARRFEYLDAVLVACRDGTKASLVGLEPLTGLADDEGWKGLGELSDVKEWKGMKGTIRSLRRYSHTTETDWDLILRKGNLWYDRVVDACRQPNRAARRESLKRIDEDLRNLKETAADATSLESAMLVNPRLAFSERLGQLCLIMLGPETLRADTQAADRGAMRFDLDKLAFSLAAYRADHGCYPERLADLTPKYVTDVPKDIFTDADLHYRREGNGFLLYSVGINGKDDGAKTYEDRKSNEDWDDLVIRGDAIPPNLR